LEKKKKKEEIKTIPVNRRCSTEGVSCGQRQKKTKIYNTTTPRPTLTNVGFGFVLDPHHWQRQHFHMGRGVPLHPPPTDDQTTEIFPFFVATHGGTGQHFQLRQHRRFLLSIAVHRQDTLHHGFRLKRNGLESG
jgi:hypothetical protein